MAKTWLKQKSSNQSWFSSNSLTLALYFFNLLSIELVNSNRMESHWFGDKILDIINWFKSDLNHFCCNFISHDKMTAGSKIEPTLTKSCLIGIFFKKFFHHTGCKSLTFSFKFRNFLIGNRVFSFHFCDNSFYSKTQFDIT